MTPAKVFSCEFCEVFKNIYFIEYLGTTASELGRYYVHIFLFEVRLEEEEHKNYLRITPECFDKLFVLAKNVITKSTAIVRDVIHQK